MKQGPEWRMTCAVIVRCEDKRNLAANSSVAYQGMVTMRVNEVKIRGMISEMPEQRQRERIVRRAYGQREPEDTDRINQFVDRVASALVRKYRYLVTRCGAALGEMPDVRLHSPEPRIIRRDNLCDSQRVPLYDRVSGSVLVG